MDRLLSGSVLIVDDEEVFREDLASLLADVGLTCITAGSGEEALVKAAQDFPDLVLCDLMMPGLSGIEVTERLTELCPGVSIIVMTAFGSMETAIGAFRKGAVDFLIKGLATDDLLRRVRRCVEERQLRREVQYLRKVVTESSAGTRLVGHSQAMESVRRLIAKVGPTPSKVLITGASGTGKELVARSLHEQGERSDRPFVAVNCAALPKELIESELFGHVRGAFTGATQNRIGFFELAGDGTLFLDEIGELPLPLQPKLLRALEGQEVVPVGGTRPITVRARIIAATNRDLEEEIAQGRFREDLFYRLRVVEIHLPLLTERREDIPALVHHLLQRLNRKYGRSVRSLDQGAMMAVMSAPWKGNVRELENALERGVLLAEEEVLSVGDLPASMTGTGPPAPRGGELKVALQAFEAEQIRLALEACAGNREEAALRLGISVATLYRRLKDLAVND